MIYKLDGVFAARLTKGGILVEVSGVGYEVLCADPEQFLLQGTGAIWIYTQMKDSSVCLFGFRSQQEREFFAELIGISGVGGKMALSLLGSLSLPEILSAVEVDDEQVFAGIAGIGAKTAKKLSMELRHRLKRLRVLVPQQPTAVTKTHVVTDARSALLNMGFADKNVREALAGIAVQADTQTAEIVRLALTRLTRGAKPAEATL